MSVDEEREMTGSVEMLALRATTEATTTTGSQFSSPRRVSPQPCYSPHSSMPASTSAGQTSDAQKSRVIRGWRQIESPSIGEHMALMEPQISESTTRLTEKAEQTSQRIEQTTAMAGETLKRAQIAQATSASAKMRIDVGRDTAWTHAADNCIYAKVSEWRCRCVSAKGRTNYGLLDGSCAHNKVRRLKRSDQSWYYCGRIAFVECLRWRIPVFLMLKNKKLLCSILNVSCT